MLDALRTLFFPRIERVDDTALREREAAADKAATAALGHLRSARESFDTTEEGPRRNIARLRDELKSTDAQIKEVLSGK